jgi:hypothetical protein
LRGDTVAQKGLPYVRSFIVEDDPEAVLQRFLTITAGTPEYTVATAGSGTIILTRRYTPTWAIIVAVVGILLFLLGLLALLVKETETLTITAAASPHGTRVSITGVVSDAMATRLNAELGPPPVPGDVSSPVGLGTGPVGATKGATWQCSSCGSEQAFSTTYCDVCGTVGDAAASTAMLSVHGQKTCPAGHAVPGASRFCPECGVPVLMQCRSGHDLPRGAKFCGECGEPAVEYPASSEPT